MELGPELLEVLVGEAVGAALGEVGEAAGERDDGAATGASGILPSSSFPCALLLAPAAVPARGRRSTSPRRRPASSGHGYATSPVAC